MKNEKEMKRRGEGRLWKLYSRPYWLRDKFAKSLARARTAKDFIRVKAMRANRSHPLYFMFADLVLRAVRLGIDDSKFAGTWLRDFPDDGEKSKLCGRAIQRELAKQFTAAGLDGEWKNNEKSKNDFINTINRAHSVELKTSGATRGNQRIAGNAISAYSSDGASWYLTVNYHGLDAYMIRFGRVSPEDWKKLSAKSRENCNITQLKDQVFNTSLSVISGEYRNCARLETILPPTTKAYKEYQARGIVTVLQAANDQHPQGIHQPRIKEEAKSFLADNFWSTKNNSREEKMGNC